MVTVAERQSFAEWLSPRRIASFWSKVDKAAPSGCWRWTASLSDCGYGAFAVRVGEKQRSRPAHRIAWELHHQRAIDAGLELDHLCRNRWCVNPDHLEPTTRRDNILRGISPAAINARRTHCVRGHDLLRLTYLKYRRCRVCHRERQATYMARKKAGLVAS